jgi:hypothetical protein
METGRWSLFDGRAELPSRPPMVKRGGARVQLRNGEVVTP